MGSGDRPGLRHLLGSKGVSLEIEQKYIDKGFRRNPEVHWTICGQGRSEEPVDNIFSGRLKGTKNKEDLAFCDIIIEASWKTWNYKRICSLAIPS